VRTLNKKVRELRGAEIDEGGRGNKEGQQLVGATLIIIVDAQTAWHEAAHPGRNSRGTDH
jgi:hypothetical protein